MFIHTYEKGRRGTACQKCLEDNPSFSVTECILLPIPSGRYFSDAVWRADFWREMGDVSLCGAVFAGYGIPEDVEKELTGRGGVVLDSEKDETFLEENAHLTAKGALGKILTSIDRDPSEMVFGIVGFGRIGSALTKLLLCVGGRVKVYSAREKTVMSLCYSGLSSERSAPDADLSQVDVLINTAPARVFDTTRAEFSGKMRVIELASGDNFPGVATERYASVPAKMFPESAGRVWAESVIRMWKERAG